MLYSFAAMLLEDGFIRVYWRLFIRVYWLMYLLLECTD